MSYTYEFEFYDELTDRNLYVHAECTNHHDSNYGADADGNRGAPADFPELDEIIVYDTDGNLVNDEAITERALKEFDKWHCDKAFDYCAQEYHSNQNEE